MRNDFLSIKQAAGKLGISIDTLRRWDKSGKLMAVRMKTGGNRFYREEDLENFSLDLFKIAENWVINEKTELPDGKFYCSNSIEFQAKLIKFEKRLSVITELEKVFPLISAMCGEIGNNSFDHNLGNWPDLPGVFFGFDLNKKYFVLADRGQGVLKTLSRVKPELDNDQDSLWVAFSEIISGRAPEARGNGLKFVREIITANDFSLIFKSGEAELLLKKDQKTLNIMKSFYKIKGCLALIKF